MPTQINEAIKEMCQDAVSQAVKALAEKYGFHEEEAHSFLKTSDLTLVNKRGTTSSKQAKSEKESGEKKTRPKTGYNFYCREMRVLVKEEMQEKLGEDDPPLKAGDLMKALGAKWKAETQEVRDHWNKAAKKLVESKEFLWE